MTLGKLEVYKEMEDGLIGITLDPAFARNSWIYLFYSEPQTHRNEAGKKIGTNRVSRFSLTGEQLDLASEKVLLRIPTQREDCCHSGGSLAFDANGNLFASVGDNTHPGASDGYSPIDERPDREPWNAQKSASNANDLRGKILRVHPEPDGSITIERFKDVVGFEESLPEEDLRTYHTMAGFVMLQLGRASRHSRCLLSA